MERKKKSKCENGNCEYQNDIGRKPVVRVSKERLRYARLWSEVELPKALERKQ